eukprot:s2547_g6.t1
MAGQEITPYDPSGFKMVQVCVLLRCYVLLSFSAELGQTTANGGKGALLAWPYELVDQMMRIDVLKIAAVKPQPDQEQHTRAQAPKGSQKRTTGAISLPNFKLAPFLSYVI